LKAKRVRHVVIVSDFANLNGGQAKVAIDSARLLADAGISVTFVGATGSASPLLDHPGIRTICLDHYTLLENPNRLRSIASGIWNVSAARALRTIIAECDPENAVVHCHGWAKALSPSIGPVLVTQRLPVVYTMHEYFLACPNGGFYDYTRQTICHRAPMSAGCLTTNCDARHVSHKVWRAARSAIARTAGRLPSGLRDIVYISETQRTAMAPYLPSTARLHRLSNPVDRGGAVVNAATNSDFVFVGRLSVEKGGVLFAEAAREVGLSAVFVGDGPEAERIRAVNPDATITGWVSPDKVQEHLSRARALVFPSLWYECQPLVPIEALLRGVPVVTGQWNAASEVVHHGVNGILYDEPSIVALSDALRQVQSIGAFDTDALAQETSPERHLDGLIEIYDGLLSE
jgi:glycosyltransferase involved in cell wall biosynthesis